MAPYRQWSAGAVQSRGRRVLPRQTDAYTVEQHFKDEHPAIVQELLNWLRRADVLGSGFYFKPVNSMQLAPNAKPAGGMRL